MRRLALIAALALLLGAQPAAAHTVGGVEATNYRTEITALTPAVPGLTVRIRDLGGRMEVTNETDQDLVVLGYQDEPYLRVGPSGVFENRRSPSLYQNRLSRNSTELVALPPEADPAAPPEWHRRSGGNTVSWPDHRIRWDAADPPGVRQNPGQAQTVTSRWSVAFLHGGSSVVVTGRIAWVPGPAAIPWFAFAVLLLAGAIAAGATRRWPALLSGGLALLVATDVVRFYGAATAGGGSVVSGLLEDLTLGVLEVMAWAAGAWAIGATQRRHAVGLYAGMASAMVIGFVSGVGDLLNLAYSQVPTALPADAARAAVSVCLGLGFGLVGGCFLALRQTGSSAPAGPAKQSPTPAGAA